VVLQVVPEHPGRTRAPFGFRPGRSSLSATALLWLNSSASLYPRLLALPSPRLRNPQNVVAIDPSATLVFTGEGRRRTCSCRFRVSPEMAPLQAQDRDRGVWQGAPSSELPSLPTVLSPLRPTLPAPSEAVPLLRCMPGCPPWQADMRTAP